MRMCMSKWEKRGHSFICGIQLFSASIFFLFKANVKLHHGVFRESTQEMEAVSPPE